MKAETALKRAAEKAVHGTREERPGRFLVSSTIKSVEYDDDVRELDITFTSGKTYRYFNVPLEIYAEFLDAGSRGKFSTTISKANLLSLRLPEGRIGRPASVDGVTGRRQGGKRFACYGAMDAGSLEELCRTGGRPSI